MSVETDVVLVFFCIIKALPRRGKLRSQQRGIVSLCTHSHPDPPQRSASSIGRAVSTNSSNKLESCRLTHVNAVPDFLEAQGIVPPLHRPRPPEPRRQPTAGPSNSNNNHSTADGEAVKKEVEMIDLTVEDTEEVRLLEVGSLGFLL